MSHQLGRFLQSHIQSIMNGYFSSSLTPSGPLDRFLRQYFLNNKAIGSHDRHVIGDKVYALVRHQLLLKNLMKGQIDYQDQLKIYNSSDFFNAMENSKLPKHLRVSFPKILFERITSAYSGDEDAAFQVCKILNTKAPITLRVNPVKSTRRKILMMLKNYLKLQAIQTQISPYGIKLISKPPLSLYQSKQFINGEFEIQDQGSQIAADMVDCRPGDLILDYCAGSGGKSLTIVHKLQGKGQIFMHDIRETAIAKAKKRFQKSGETNIQFHINEDKLSQMKFKMDWVIVDAPCTGVGTIRRNPDLKYRFSNQWLKQNTLLQQQIINRAVKYLNKNGKLLYITCSLLREQNEEQVSKIIKKYGFQVVNNQFLRAQPTKNGMDGMFAVCFKR